MADQETVLSKVQNDILLERLRAEAKKHNSPEGKDKEAIMNSIGGTLLRVADRQMNSDLTPGQACGIVKFHELKLPPECDKYLKPSSKK